MSDGDIKTYSALTQIDQPFDKTVPMTDLEELRRLAEANGLGTELYDTGNAGDDDDELRETFSELGIGS